ncbi:MAG: Type I secretion system ATPase, LssB family LapB [Candidatus Ozemobacter sibiricus]|jgi:NHLM bacteriocin system ABC transporter peptidase/ATP-binding protein|uniref:Type I secretion system ATPase, LssB family LapB n=1 Tax=Candidatus Ozemobacter sibiricus TaxID=2268124 RepID=A0A367Z7H0_9BACT|nr:MAG: Type I secretion system ATPase, LssB family LapB [Candidatus Ozemobacter sibiricus]
MSEQPTERSSWRQRLERALFGLPGYRRAVTPTVLQMEAVECGAAALAMIMGYYRRFVPLETLRQEAGVSRDGTKATNILKVARKYGFVAKGFKKEPATLLEMRMPVIVFWNFNHFLVVEGFTRHEVYLNDPAQGRRVVSHEEFDQGFTGVVLAIEPGPDFRPGGSLPSPWKALWRRLAGLWSALAFIVLVTLTLVVPGIIAPTYTRVFVDMVVIGGRFDWVKPLLVVMALAVAFQATVTAVQKWVLARLQQRISLSMTGRFFNHVLGLPLAFFTQRYAGEVSNRIGLNTTVAGLVTGELAAQSLNAAMVVFFLAVMFSYSVPLTIIVIAMMLISTLVVRLLAKKREEMVRRLSRENGQLAGITIGGLISIETIKASGAESDFFARWAGTLTRVQNGMQESARLSSIQQVPLGMISSLTNALILAVGGMAVVRGLLTPGMLVAYQTLTGSVLGPFNELLSLSEKFHQVKDGLNRLDDVLIQPVENTTADAAAGRTDRPVTVLRGHLEMRRLTFGYNPLDPPFIEDFSLTLTPGKRVALVGGSGSGKSTIAKLVCGLYQPWSGEVLFDGRPKQSIAKIDLASGFAFVDQDIFLFAGTVRENLSLWDASMPEADIIRAARDAEIHDDIVARQGAYDCPVAEGGTNFSGGQRQRLEIARALASNPAILVLDEATSALDPTTEKLVDDNIRRRGCTCLIVAHRLSTIRDCDEIIVMEWGRIVQRGTHDELIKVEGPYSRLIQVEGS